MGSAASTAWTLGKEAAAKPNAAAGMRGVAQAAGNAIRSRAANAGGLRQAAEGGRQSAWNALNQTAAKPGGAAAESGTPAWAQAMRAQQSARHHRQIALHAVSQGDRGGASATPDIKERDA
jgi:type IV secretion system protein TrbL